MKKRRQEILKFGYEFLNLLATFHPCRYRAVVYYCSYCCKGEDKEANVLRRRKQGLATAIYTVQIMTSHYMRREYRA